MHARFTVSRPRGDESPNNPIADESPSPTARKPGRWSEMTSKLSVVRQRGQDVSSKWNDRIKGGGSRFSQSDLSKGGDTVATAQETVFESNTGESSRMGLLSVNESKNTLNVGQSYRGNYVEPIKEQVSPDESQAFEWRGKTLTRDDAEDSWAAKDFEEMSFKWAKKIHEEEVEENTDEETEFSGTLDALLESTPRPKPPKASDDFTIHTTASARIKADRRSFLLHQQSDASLEEDLEATPVDMNKPWRSSSHHRRGSLPGTMKESPSEDSFENLSKPELEVCLVHKKSKSPSRTKRLQRANSERMIAPSPKERRASLAVPPPTPPRQSLPKKPSRRSSLASPSDSRRSLKRSKSERSVLTEESPMHREFMQFIKEDSRRHLVPLNSDTKSSTRRHIKKNLSQVHEEKAAEENPITPIRSSKSGKSRRDTLKKQVSTPCLSSPTKEHATEKRSASKSQQNRRLSMAASESSQAQRGRRPSLHDVFEWNRSQRTMDTNDPDTSAFLSKELLSNGSSHTKIDRRKLLQRSQSTTAVQQFHINPQWPPTQPNRELHAQFYDKSIRASSRDLKKKKESGMKSVSAATMLQIMEPVSNRELMTLMDKDVKIDPPRSSDASVCNYGDILDNMSLVSGHSS
jgi:hypothetical protein